MITHAGIEGGAVYALSGALSETIASHGAVVVHIDLRPDLTHATLEHRLATARAKQSLSNLLRKAAKLSPVAIGLLRETSPSAALARFTPRELAARIKAVPLPLAATMPLARAISTGGGIALREIDEHFMLRRRPGVFVAGEMLDWDAPTGGYLLQACFATGAAAGEGVLKWLSGLG